MEWNSICSENDISQLIDQSHTLPVVIFKHSTTCPISSMAKMRLESKWEKIEQPVVYYFLDLHAYRQLSNQVARELGIRHESPQLILIKDGMAIYDASHFDISVESLVKELNVQYA